MPEKWKGGGAHTRNEIQSGRSPAADDTGSRGPAHAAIATHGLYSRPAAPDRETAQRTVEPMPNQGVRGRNGGAGAGAQRVVEIQNPPSPGVDPAIIDEIRWLWRRHQQWTRARVRLELQAQAVCRGLAGGDKAEGKKLWKAALKRWKALRKRAGVEEASLGMGSDDVTLVPFLAANESFERFLRPLTRELENLAERTPHWQEFFHKVRGFGLFSLAGLIGEAGDPWAYRNPSALWKRMGLAVVDGGRQRRTTDKELAERHGFSPRRAAWAFQTGENLVKQAALALKAVYAERKAAREAAGWGKSKKQRHNDARRYMVKRLLRDLWVNGNGGAHQRSDIQSVASPAVPSPQNGGAHRCDDTQISSSPAVPNEDGGGAQSMPEILATFSPAAVPPREEAA